MEVTITPSMMLRSRMVMYGIDQKKLARMLNRGSTYVSVRMNGHEEWTIGEAIKMMGILKIKPEDFLNYFGKGEM